MDERASDLAERDLSFQHSLLAALSATSLDATLVVGADGDLLFANQQFFTLWGLPDTGSGARSLAAYRQAIAGLLVDPDTFFGRADDLDRHPDEESRDTVRLRDGRILDRHSRPVSGADGARYGRVWFYRDITDQWRLSEGLRQSEASLAIAQRIARLGSWSWDVRANTVFWSDETFRIFGYDPHAVAPTYDLFIEHIRAADRERVGAALAAAIEDGASYEIEFGIVLPNGSPRTIHARGELARDRDGRPRQMTGTVLDISERTRAEEALRESEERLRAASESGFDVFQVLRAVRDARGAIVDFTFIHLNRRAEEFLRLDRAAAVG
ncbi:MAG: PAS domain-containing protein, partial [Vicinamibacterales bacterium]